MSEERITRRDIIKKAAYITPVILTLLAAPSFASGGSGREERDEGYKNDERYKKDERGHKWRWNYERNEKKGNKWD